MSTELSILNNWHATQKELGLVDIKFTPGSNLTRDTTSEDFAAENNRVNRLIDSGQFVARPDVF